MSESQSPPVDSPDAVQASVPALSDIKKCGKCDKSFPIHVFDDDPTMCAFCVAKNNLKLAREENKAAASLMTDLIDTSDKPVAMPAIEEICAKAVDYFGGLDAFIERWGNHFEEILQRKPAQIGALHHFMGMFKLIKEANEHVHTKEVETMTAEEIKREQQIRLLEMMSEAAIDDSKRKFFVQALRLKDVAEEFDGD